MAKTIQIYYHPAVKKIEFKKDDGTPFVVTGNGKSEPKLPEVLQQWKEGSFVLQEHGKDFFDSITKALDGHKEIDLYFYGTQIDCEDFYEMVNHYNESEDKKAIFTAKKGAVLLSMDMMYNEVEKFGKDAVQSLNIKLEELINAGGENQIKNKFQAELKAYISKIEDKIDALKSTEINICFVGTYSAGKSSLINAIIGEKILPEEDESKTAKFYIISFPKSGESENVSFELNGDETTVKWNEESMSLELTDKGTQSGSHPFRETIEKCIDECKEQQKHEQFYALLDLLNGEATVDVKIRVHYPIPINTNEMSFTIYDTPGTGSNTTKHKNVLEKALSEQSHSIVVFVGGVTKLEGEGNSLLLEILNGDNQNGIDLDRSLYVINRSDTTDVEELPKYQNEAIKLKDSQEVADAKDEEAKKAGEAKLTIPLKDKKLFFTSASRAYAAKALKMDLASKEVDEDGKPISKEGRTWDEIKPYDVYYKHNRYGNSEAATKRTIATAETKAEDADIYERAYINAGLFSLVEAIQEYGKKYAMATKVNALVSTVESIFIELKKNAKTQKDMCDNEVDRLQKDLDAIKWRITNEIDQEYGKHAPKKNGINYVLNEKDSEEVGVDPRSVEKVRDDINIRIVEAMQEMQNAKTVKNAKRFDDFLSIFRTSFSNDAAKRKLKPYVKNEFIDNRVLATSVNEGLDEYINRFNTKQKDIIASKQRCFKNTVINVIKGDNDLTPAAKDYLVRGLENEFEIPKVDDYLANIREKVRDCITTKGKWIFKIEVVDTHKLLEEIEDLINEALTTQTQEFTEKFCVNLQYVIDEVKHNFEKNAESYSVQVQEIKKNKTQVVEIANEIENASLELENLIDNLKTLVWKGTSHEQTV
ncbi:MAG: dynamin family protein [Oscillospiraceae bacterium]|nr:dynamin family protein [Oscillospiraceae bacterium]